MHRQPEVVITEEVLILSLQARENGHLSSQKHLTNTKKGISMDSIPNLLKENSKTGLTSLALSTMISQTFMALKIRTKTKVVNMLTSTSATLGLEKPGHRENNNNSRNELSNGTPETLIHGLETKMIVKNFILARLVKVPMRVISRRRKTGRQACLKTSKPTMKNTLKSLREQGVLPSSTVLSSNNSRTTDTILRLRLKRKQREKLTTKSLRQALTPISTP